MKASKVARCLVVLSGTLFLGACASNNMGYSTPTMSDEEFVNSSAEVRSDYLQTIDAESRLLETKKTTEYQAGRAVYYHDPQTGVYRTEQWDKRQGFVFMYPGRKDSLGIETSGVVAFKADENGAVEWHTGPSGMPQPVVIMANVATQEGFGRTLIRLGFQPLAAALNGAVAAEIYSDAACDNCGNTTLVNQGGPNVSQSISEADAGSSSSSTVSPSCPTGKCGFSSMDELDD